MENLHTTLKTIFGYDAFRGEQLEIIKHALKGRNSMVIMPTGGGKSLCYQLPALVTEGTTIVISPLIALMQDQVDALCANGVAAAAINSTIPLREIRITEERIGSEDLKLLYVSPEKAITQDFIQRIKGKRISLVAVDESHCVSVWGNDFRKDYTYIPQLLQQLPEVPVMALTATADRATQEDIVAKLSLKSPRTFISSFERPNLHISVMPGAGRTEQLIRFVKEHAGESGIIYCLSRKSTEAIAHRLRQQGIAASHYHADMSSTERQRIQRQFQVDQIRVICATIAFGMGIDKSNVRYVLHFNLPKNMESYYQEIGRAGRDGLPAITLLFFSMADGQILRSFIDRSEADDSYKMLQRSKLARMIEFGQATSCRTNMILSYFGEHRSHACGHCDNCLNPPEMIDGTELAQKALSAIYRLKEKVAINMLVDVLRGSGKASLIRMNFHRIKTYGTGKDISRPEWMHLVSQMVNKGLLEVDFTHYNCLKITSVGKEILFGRQGFLYAIKKEEKNTYGIKRQQQGFTGSELMVQLKGLRTSLAREAGLPPYTVFNDNTLEEMARHQPMDLASLAKISGVGAHKLEQYGDRFLELIRLHNKPPESKKNPKGNTYKDTLELYRDGNGPEEIAKKRNLTPGTIFSHLIRLYQSGENIDLHPYLPEGCLEELIKVRSQIDNTGKLGEWYEAMEGKYEFHQIRIGLAIVEREN